MTSPLPDHSPHLLATRDILAGIVAGSAPAAHIVLAILNALLAMGAPLAETNRPLISDIIALLAQATPIVAEATAPRYAKEAVYLGVGALSGLLDQLLIPTGEREPLGLSVSRMNHAALLADELDAIQRRVAIERGGDLLRRKIRITAARNAVSSAPLH